MASEALSIMLPFLQNNPNISVVAFSFLALLLASKPVLHLIDWFKKKNQIKADARSTDAKTDIETFKAVEDNKQEVINTLMADMKNMKESFDIQKVEYRSEIKELKSEIQELRIEVKKMNKTVNDKMNDNYKLETCIKLKNHEIAMLRSWISKTLQKVGESVTLDPVPEPFEERRI